jgi:hypothetical protein
MATYTKVNDFVLNLCEVMDIDGDVLKFDLTLTDPAAGTDATADGNGVLANIAPITYTNYTDDLTADRTFTSGTLTHTQTAGTFTLDYGADIVITASGGAIADFRYVVPWDDTPTSPADPLINVWDHGSTISLADGDSATLQFNASGWFTLA